MDTAGFYQQGSSVTHSLSESSFFTPPNGHARYPPSAHSHQAIYHLAVDQKLDRVLSMVIDQKEAGECTVGVASFVVSMCVFFFHNQFVQSYSKGRRWLI